MLDRLRVDELAENFHHSIDATERRDASSVELHAIASLMPRRDPRVIGPCFAITDERTRKQGRAGDEKLIIAAKLRLPNRQHGNWCRHIGRVECSKRLRGNLRRGFGHAITRKYRPTECSGRSPCDCVESPATYDDGAEALWRAMLTRHEIMHLSGHERCVGDMEISKPMRECFRLPTRGKMFKAATCGKRARGDAEAANMMQRQREAPARTCGDLKMRIHRIGRNTQRMFAQGDPFRFAAAARCFKKNMRAKFGEIRKRIRKTTRRTRCGVVPKIAVHQ